MGEVLQMTSGKAGLRPQLLLGQTEGIHRLLAEGEGFLTANGRPFAVVTPVEPDSVEEELQAIRRARAKVAVERLRTQARAKGLDRRILQEYEEVLRRPQFAFSPAAVAEVLEHMQSSGDPIPALPLAANLPDPDDLPFLEVAATAEAVLVTGNRRHYPKKAAGRVVVVTPAECLEQLRRSDPLQPNHPTLP